MLPFNRLFELVDAAVGSGAISDDVFAQIGESSYAPRNFKYERFIEKGRFDTLVDEASIVIGHAGIGVIIQCLEANTPLLVLPRLAKLGEHVNDHQVSTAQKFEQLGHVLSFCEADFSQKLEQLKSFTPLQREPNVKGVSERVSKFLAEEYC